MKYEIKLRYKGYLTDKIVYKKEPVTHLKPVNNICSHNEFNAIFWRVA